MSIPFSNTHYRIPRGFANLLEGLTREVLRQQPQDIPNFAARYFAELLKKREDSGYDPAEWGAALEDRYYNNHSFQRPEEKTVSARRIEDVQLSQDLTSTLPENEEDEQKDGAPSGPTEDASDRRESVLVPDSAEEPHNRLSPPQSAEVEHKQEKSVTDRLLQEHSATTIQAAFRGHQVRERVRKLKEESGEKLPLQEYTASDVTSEEAAPRQDQRVEEAAPRQDQRVERAAPHQDHRVEEAAPRQDHRVEEAAPRQDQRVEEAGPDQRVDLEPHAAETPREDPTPAQPQDSDIETRPLTGEASTTEDVSGGETVREEDLKTPTGQTQGPQVENEEQKEDDPENLLIEDGAEGNDVPRTPREEDDSDNVAVTENVEDHDLQPTHNEEEEEAKEDHAESKDVVDGVDVTPTLNEEKDLDRVAIENDGEGHDLQVHEEKTTMESHELEASGGRSSTEGPDTGVTQEAKTTEEQQESADLQDNETMTNEQLEDNREEPADHKITGDQQDSDHSVDGEDPREESEAFRNQPEEALDIALDDPDANAAAAKIQAGFRGHMTRKKMKSGDKDVKHKDGKEGGSCSSAQGEHEGD